MPVLGPIYTRPDLRPQLLVYVAFLAVPLTWWVLFRTRFGLRLRAVGENPAAVDTAGISVPRLRYRAVLITGLLCGIAGAYLSIGAATPASSANMTAGRGFIALAALIFAKWRPWPALGRLPAVRAPRRHLDPLQGTPCCRSSARCRCRSSRRCPIS